MDKLLIDCNILIDWLTNRPRFSTHAEKLLTLIENKKAIGYVSPLTLSNTYYILRKNTSKRIANEFLNDSKKLFSIIGITREITIYTIDNKFKDFEDDLHFYTALSHKLDYIITKNKTDFTKDSIKVLTAEEYLKLTR